MPTHPRRHPRRFPRSTVRRRPSARERRRPRDDRATPTRVHANVDDRTTTARRRRECTRTKKIPHIPLAPSRVSASPASRSRASPKIRIAFPLECMRSNARARTRGRDELARVPVSVMTISSRKKYPYAFVRSFVRSRVAFVRARARVTTTTSQRGERNVPCGGTPSETRWMCRRPWAYTSIDYEVPRCPTDRCIKNKTLKRCRGEKSVFFEVIFVPLCVCF